MSAKTINWGKWASISFVAAFGCAAIGWTFTKASTYAVLPDQVSDHERRISALESENATNQVRLDDRLDNIDRDLNRIFRRLDQSSAMNDMSARSAGSASRGNDTGGTNVVSER